MSAPAATPPAVDLDGVARRFGRSWPLRGVSLRVAAGEMVALTGRNGSGKTTLLRIIATALRPTRGGGRVFGRDLAGEADAVRGMIGLLGHSPGIYRDLTAAENLRFAQRMLNGADDPHAATTALERVGLAAHADVRAATFSAGMQRRLALARLMLVRPRVLLLDEPFASLDDDGAATVDAFMADVRRGGGAVIVATHSPERVEAEAARIVRLEAGRARTLDGRDAGPASVSPVDGGRLASSAGRRS